MENADTARNPVDFALVIVSSNGFEPFERFAVPLHSAFVVHSLFGRSEFGFRLENERKGVAQFFADGFFLFVEVYLREVSERESPGIVYGTFVTAHEFFAVFVGHRPFAGNHLHERGFSSAVASNHGDPVVVVDYERSVAHENFSSGQFVALDFDV